MRNAAMPQWAKMYGDFTKNHHSSPKDDNYAMIKAFLDKSPPDQRNDMRHVG